MKLTEAEQLIVFLLTEIASKTDALEGSDAGIIKEALFTGNHWAIKDILSGVFSDPTDEDIVSEVHDILGMWSVLERETDEKFPGFDGNREGRHTSVARMLTEKLGCYEDLKGRVSHGVAGLDAYRRMYAKYRELLLSGQDFGPDEAKAVIAERIHPENR